MQKLLLFLSMCSVLPAFSQNFCNTEEHHQFDFWLGEWEVYANDALAGTNKIILDQDSCVLVENWVSNSSTYTGTSYNYYNAQDSTWNQTWIDNSGYSLILKGSWNGTSMVLESEISDQGTVNRITWTPNDDGTVRQLWEYSAEFGLEWSPVFDGLYKRPER